MAESAKNHPSPSTNRRKSPVRTRRFLLLFALQTLLLSILLLDERLASKDTAAQAQARAEITLGSLRPQLIASQVSPTATSTLSLDASTQPTSPVIELRSTITVTVPPSLTIQNNTSDLERLASVRGTIFLAMQEGRYFHLFAYHPQLKPLTRLTDGAWDDITPSVSPKGDRLAFASNRGGRWDLYILDLTAGLIQQVTDTPEYDASPSWSPDGQWLAYESYIEENLELFIRPASQEVSSENIIRLTESPAADYAPAWSPNGRHIAFVSNRTGDDEIWLADLDQIDARFQNSSRNPRALDRHPAWSPDGRFLAWASSADGYEQLTVIAPSDPSYSVRRVGSGGQPAWDPSGSWLVTPVDTPNQVYLTGYNLESSGLLIPPLPLTGPVAGVSWSALEQSVALPSDLSRAAQATLTPAWVAALTPLSDVPSGRQRVVQIEDLGAPYPMLQDLVDESFLAFRADLAKALGWDFLSTLENAFVPLTTPLFPGLLGDWLYTGRAIAFNTAPMNAGWLVVAREDFGSQTYWRVFLRTRFQDGSQGRPLQVSPWNLNARYSGDPRFYEQGGALAAIPPGYWLDLTDFSAGYGWQRLPALTTWQHAFGAARFNELVFSEGRDWLSAMEEVYPAQALWTPTPVLPPTYTPTPTPRPTRTPTPTRTPWPSRTPTPTRTPTSSPSITSTAP